MSTLFLSATREMHGGKLSCKVENPLVPKSEIKASQKLQIHCKCSSNIKPKFRSYSFHTVLISSWLVTLPLTPK